MAEKKVEVEVPFELVEGDDMVQDGSLFSEVVRHLSTTKGEEGGKGEEKAQVYSEQVIIHRPLEGREHADIEACAVHFEPELSKEYKLRFFLSDKIAVENKRAEAVDVSIRSVPGYVTVKKKYGLDASGMGAAGVTYELEKALDVRLAGSSEQTARIQPNDRQEFLLDEKCRSAHVTVKTEPTMRRVVRVGYRLLIRP